MKITAANPSQEKAKSNHQAKVLTNNKNAQQKQKFGHKHEKKNLKSQSQHDVGIIGGQVDSWDSLAKNRDREGTAKEIERTSYSGRDRHGPKSKIIGLNEGNLESSSSISRKRKITSTQANSINNRDQKIYVINENQGQAQAQNTNQDILSPSPANDLEIRTEVNGQGQDSQKLLAQNSQDNKQDSKLTFIELADYSKTVKGNKFDTLWYRNSFYPKFTFFSTAEPIVDREGRKKLLLLGLGWRVLIWIDLICV